MRGCSATMTPDPLDTYNYGTKTGTKVTLCNDVMLCNKAAIDIASKSCDNTLHTMIRVHHPRTSDETP